MTTLPHHSQLPLLNKPQQETAASFHRHHYIWTSCPQKVIPTKVCNTQVPRNWICLCYRGIHSNGTKLQNKPRSNPQLNEKLAFTFHHFLLINSNLRRIASQSNLVFSFVNPPSRPSLATRACVGPSTEVDAHPHRHLAPRWKGTAGTSSKLPVVPYT